MCMCESVEGIGEGRIERHVQPAHCYCSAAIAAGMNATLSCVRLTIAAVVS